MEKMIPQIYYPGLKFKKKHPSRLFISFYCILVAFLVLVPAVLGTLHAVETQNGDFVPSPIYFFTIRGGSEKLTGLGNYKPDGNKTNLTELDNKNPMDFKLNMIGKAYDKATDINILLSMNSKDGAGKMVHVQMLFDYNNDGIEDTKVDFPEYLTTKTFDVENITLHPESVSGTFQDFRGLDSGGTGENAPGGTVTVRIWRNDDQDDSKLIIYCGAYNRASRASIPYYKGPKDNETNGGGWTIEILVAVVIIMGGVLLFLKAGGSKKPKKGQLREEGRGRRKSKRKK